MTLRKHFDSRWPLGLLILLLVQLTVVVPTGLALAGTGEIDPGKGARHLLCKAPEGPFRQKVPGTFSAGDPPVKYTEGTHGGGRLQYIDGLPVLVVQGTPEEIGDQIGALVTPGAKRLLDYPRRAFLGGRDRKRWEQLLEASKALWNNIPADHRKEIDAAVRGRDIDHDVLVAGNVMMDVYRGLGCSAMMVEASRSTTGQPLFGRNLDFPSAGFLHEYSLVTVCRPKGKHAFASVGFAGMFGCLSGMNDAGLAIAVHEVLVGNDGSHLFNPKGVPYTFTFRRLLEECSTADEAEKLLRSMERTTLLNLSVCDRKQACVFEITPKQVVRRKSLGGLCACTNDFRSPELAGWFTFCDRYPKLDPKHQKPKLSLADVKAKLHEVNKGSLTLQSMVFEPVALRLHLSFGLRPASMQPMRTLDLKPLFEGK
ncbi:MAG: hypothetical protein JW818_05580 [Pirellulales bacterium]|nr:hypothetical protein [Pirellulales bacterium]